MRLHFQYIFYCFYEPFRLIHTSNFPKVADSYAANMIDLMKNEDKKVIPCEIHMPALTLASSGMEKIPIIVTIEPFTLLNLHWLSVSDDVISLKCNFDDSMKFS